MARQKMTSRKKMTPAQKYERLDRRYSDFTAGAISIHNAWLGFMVEQEAKDNSKATLTVLKVVSVPVLSLLITSNLCRFQVISINNFRSQIFPKNFPKISQK